MALAQWEKDQLAKEQEERIATLNFMLTRAENDAASLRRQLISCREELAKAQEELRKKNV